MVADTVLAIKHFSHQPPYPLPIRTCPRAGLVEEGAVHPDTKSQHQRKRCQFSCVSGIYEERKGRPRLTHGAQLLWTQGRRSGAVRRFCGRRVPVARHRKGSRSEDPLLKRRTRLERHHQIYGSKNRFVVVRSWPQFYLNENLIHHRRFFSMTVKSDI